MKARVNQSSNAVKNSDAIAINLTLNLTILPQNHLRLLVKYDMRTHAMHACTLWDDKIDAINKEATLRITNGYISMHA